MIYDAITSMDNYFKGNQTWTAILNFVQGLDEETEVGRFEICEGVFAMASRYSTKSAVGSEMEVHKKYTDVQFLLSGREYIGYQVPPSTPVITQAFNESKDIGFFESTAYGTVFLERGVFALFPAGEFHMPQLYAKDESEAVLKVVVKIEANLLS
ncbi:MAG: YhcH/YjgK/YiaL family protein [Lentisphaeria bacterium]|nr:YhcH/YjgK/YiaL family protein [Lentisphaeria bacterium]